MGLPTFRQRRQSAKIGGLSRQSAAMLKGKFIDENTQVLAVRVGMVLSKRVIQVHPVDAAGRALCN